MEDTDTISTATNQTHLINEQNKKLKFIENNDQFEMKLNTLNIIKKKSSKKLIKKLENLDINEVGLQIIDVLKEIVKENESLIESKTIQMPKNSPFYSQILPQMSLEDYLKRIIKYTKLEISTMVLVGIFIDKLCETSNFYITQNNLYR